MASPLLLSIYDRTWVNRTHYLIVRNYDERWSEDRELKYLDMIKDGRGSILVNNKDLMDNIARGIFGDDEESGLCLAHLN